MSLTYIFFFLVFILHRRIVCGCPIGTNVVENCPELDPKVIGDKIDYRITSENRMNSRWLICPRSDSNISEWRVTMLDESDALINNGSYCSDKEYNSSQLCMDSNGTLRIYPAFLPTKNGFLRLFFCTVQVTTNVTVRFGERGVHSLTGNTIQLIEGDILSLDFILFFPSTVSNIRFFHNGTTSSANIAQDDRCVTPALGGDVPGIRSLQISSVTISDSGSYTLRANNGTYESTITVTVLKDNSSVPEQSSIVVTSPSMSFVASTSIITTTGSSSSNIATTRSSNSSSNDVSTTIVWIIIGVGIFFAIAILIILCIVIVLCYYITKRRSSSNGQPRGVAVVSIDSPPKAKSDVARPRLGSTSSERPLTMGESTSSVNTPLSDVPADYTAVYCSSGYTQCSGWFKEKYGDLVHIVDNWEDIRLCIIHPNCKDILIFADPSDEVFREIMSCGIDPPHPDKRDKLRIVLFSSSDHFPTNTIAVNGYKVVMVEGSSDDGNTLSTAVTKAEFPQLMNELRRKNREETDNNSSEIVALLRQLLQIQTTSTAIQAETLDIQKEHVDVNRDISGLLEKQFVAESDSAGKTETDI